MELQELNHWWTEKEVRKEFAPQTYRELYFEIEKDIERRQVQAIIGLRRTGKSTILFQLIDQLIRVKNNNPRNIFYYSYDEPEFQEKRIEDMLKEYSRITNVDYNKEKVYLFLDEVQKARNWEASTKLVYDNLKNIKMIISGSASLNILADARRSLAGRVIYYELKPLNFKEFLTFKGLNEAVTYPLLYKDIVEKELDSFLFRPFPEIIREDEINFVRKYVRNSIIEPVILKDIPKQFKEVDILLLESLLNIFMTNPGQYLQLDELSSEQKRAKKTLYKALSYLESSFLIRKILNFRPSIRAASQKLSRIYAYHPSLTIPFNIPMEKFVENLVLSELDAKYYWRERGKEIDALVDSLPVEVKYVSKVGKRDVEPLKYFYKRYCRTLKIDKMFMVTKDLEGEIANVRLIPLSKFCLRGLNW
ncbi:MAG: ATP-binding protein [Nitrososphaeria archaeon]